jgi:hypothetical protein
MIARLGHGRAALLAAASLSAFAAACEDAAYCFDCTESASSTADSSSASSTGEGGDQTVSVGAFTTTSGGGDDCDADTETDVENCGSCGNRCALPGAVPACEAGQCVVSECLPGNYDLDDEVPGCEYACALPEPGPEICDGLDNDCDGLVDTEDPELEPPDGLCNETPGTPCEEAQTICVPGQGWVCDYPTGVELVGGVIRDQEALCDGIDGDCDGEVDEFFLALGDSCNDGALGACRDFGIVECDPDNPLTTYCDLTELPDGAEPADAESCNGIDDDCDGFVDEELLPAAFAMLDVGGGVLMDVYEASRPDATDDAAGFVENVSCSNEGVLPWTGGGYAEAEAACASRGVGFRLCSALELEAACRGAEDDDYPYGDDFDDDACNGVERGAGEALPTGSLATCDTTAGIFDLSGNVAEWSSTQTNGAATPDRIFQLHGGSYLAPELGLACTIELAPRALEVTLLPNIGFRCCYQP